MASKVFFSEYLEADLRLEAGGFYSLNFLFSFLLFVLKLWLFSLPIKRSYC